MFVTFIGPHENKSWSWSTNKWLKPPLESRAKTGMVIEDLSIPTEQLPNLTSSSVYYLIDDRSDGRDAFTGHLYIRDEEKNRYWYFNVTS